MLEKQFCRTFAFFHYSKSFEFLIIQAMGFIYHQSEISFKKKICSLKKKLKKKIARDKMIPLVTFRDMY